jgi:cytochrome c oxidase cbb3-type subunit 3
MTKHEAKPLSHNYDGIQELDNPLPRWWLLTFYGTIIFAAFYLGYYELGPGPTAEIELANNLREIEAKKQAATPVSEIDSAKLNAFIADKDRLAEGRVVYDGKCLACHAAGGAGMIGPNLADNFWLHGSGSHAEIFKLVAEGVADKGMPPWRGMLKPDELYAVTAYVIQLKGTSPANPKAAQGVEVKN